MNLGRWSNPRSGSKPARRNRAEYSYPRRAEFFAPPDTPPAARTSRHTESAPWRFGIVASEYNREYVDGLIGFAKDELLAVAPQSETTVIRVPGSFEIPIGVQALIQHRQVDAVLAFGVIFDGETMHAELIAGAVTKALMNLSLQHKIPVLHEVLVVKNDQQATERCLLPKINRGVEAARAAIRILNTLTNLAKD